MSFDTKYRPQGFSSVLGQQSTIKILLRFISSGQGRQQSYLFAGPFGSGKTTLGRLMARALLCNKPTAEGHPCDECPSCRSFLDGKGGAAEYIEVDAATNSGKAHITALTDEIQYATFSGKHRIYLFDEAHRLSPHALDALLKPMEDNLPKSQDKQLVCIFCTTEPEKMAVTIPSRCAPVFVIEPVPPDLIAERMAYICEQEGLEFDPEVLQTIAEVTESHIRDAFKAIEGISMLGPIDRANSAAYLHLDRNTGYLEALEALGKDQGASMTAMKKVLESTSPVTAYRKLAEVAMMAYQLAHGGPKPPVFWDRERLAALNAQHGVGLLGIASRMASRPGRPTASMLYCDLALLHQSPAPVMGDAPQVVVQTTVATGVTPVISSESLALQKAAPAPSVTDSKKTSDEVKNGGGNIPSARTGDCGGVHRDVRAIRRIEKPSASTPSGENPDDCSPAYFSRLLALCLKRMDDGADFGPTRRLHMGSR